MRTSHDAVTMVARMSPGMQSSMDVALVGVVLLASVFYALLALGPRSLRGRLLRMVGFVLRRAPLQALRALAGELERRAAKTDGGCGGCGSCGPEKPAAGRGEVVIPASKIGRR